VSENEEMKGICGYKREKVSETGEQYIVRRFIIRMGRLK
jgi:hypothetical protein